jgi:putative DNA primase/helicase
MDYNIHDVCMAMRADMAKNGINIGEEIFPDGQIHRFAPTGRPRGNKHAWYVLFNDDFPAGAYGDWREGVWHRWSFKGHRTMSPREIQSFRKQIKRASELRRQEAERGYQHAQTIAIDLWSQAIPCETHPYLTKKKVHSHGLKTRMGMLLIPLHDTSGKIQSIQFINAEGQKRFMQGGRLKGGHYVIEGDVSKIIICEGYATAASVHEVHGYRTIVAFNANNLKPVAETIRRKYPRQKIIICADNDAHTQGNPGLTKAHEAAKAVGAQVAYPPICGDFNDWYKGRSDA